MCSGTFVLYIIYALCNGVLTVLLKSFMCHLQPVFFSIKNVRTFWYFNSTPPTYMPF